MKNHPYSVYRDRMQLYLNVIRLAYGFNTVDFAYLIDHSFTSIIRYENYKNKMPTDVYIAFTYVLAQINEPDAKAIVDILVYRDDVTEEERADLYRVLDEAKYNCGEHNRAETYQEAMLEAYRKWKKKAA